MSTHDTHSHDHSDHGSVRSYATGFILSVILTAVPFWLVMSGGTGDKVVTTLIVLGFAVVQILVHMVYFLHMTAKKRAGRSCPPSSPWSSSSSCSRGRFGSCIT